MCQSVLPCKQQCLLSFIVTVLFSVVIPLFLSLLLSRFIHLFFLHRSRLLPIIDFLRECDVLLQSFFLGWFFFFE